MATLTGSHVKSPSHGSLGFELKFTEKTMFFLRKFDLIQL